MPKAKSATSSPDARSMPCQYSSISFRPHSRSTGTLRRNQACKQCRKRKSLSGSDAGRPCKACLRAYAVVVANLVKRGLPLDSVQPECVYDGDSDSGSGSERSSPVQLTSSPVSLPSSPPELQQRAPTPPDPLPQQSDYDLSLFAPHSHADILELSLDLGTYPEATTPTSASSPQTSPYYSTMPSPQVYCYQLSQAYLSPQPSPQLFESDLAQLSYWMYQGPQTASAYAQVSDCDLSRDMWDRQL